MRYLPGELGRCPWTDGWHYRARVTEITGIFVLKVGNLANLAILAQITNFQDGNTYNFCNPSALRPIIRPRAPLELSQKVSYCGVGLQLPAPQPTPRRAVLGYFWGPKNGPNLALCPMFTPAGDRLLGNI